MAKITSRQPASTASHVEQLSEILCAASLGTLGDASDPGVVAQIETTMDGLLDQTDALFAGMLETCDHLALHLAATQLDLTATLVRLDVTEDALANLIGNIDYDEAMDHAALDLMDAFCASGSADTTADGALAFDERVTFSKEDLKPMLRQAIVRWVELKMAQ